jgi:hypothetical protein
MVEMSFVHTGDTGDTELGRVMRLWSGLMVVMCGLLEQPLLDTI